MCSGTDEGNALVGIADRLKLAKEVQNVRILTIDIEWRPMLSYHWGLFDQNIGITQIADDGGLLCFAAKWMGDKEVLYWSENDGHDVMVKAAHNLLSEADVVITYNGDRYDIKKLNAEFMLAKMPPPRPFRSIDLLKSNKARFDLPSRKLDFLVQRSGVGSKVPHNGFELWTGCMNGDPAAWKLMEKYCKGDVVVTEKAYLRLLPWITNAPHLAMFTREGHSCPYCGSKKLERSGIAHANVTSYQMYECKHCGGWVRGTTPYQDPTRTRAIR